MHEYILKAWRSGEVSVNFVLFEKLSMLLKMVNRESDKHGTA